MVRGTARGSGRRNRTGQTKMLRESILARKSSKRSILAPYEKAKRQYVSLSSVAKRRAKKRRDLKGKVRDLQGKVAAISEQTAGLIEEKKMDTMVTRHKALMNSVNRLVVAIDGLNQNCSELDELSNGEDWKAAKQGLSQLGLQLFDQVEQHEKTTESWMNIQFNMDMTTVGAGVKKLPGHIAYSPFTVYDPPFDHLDAANAAMISKTSK